MRTRLFAIAAIVFFPAAALLAGACAAPVAGDTASAEDVGAIESPLDQGMPLPYGLTCGMYHTGGPYGAGCQGVADGVVPSGYDVVFLGDYGVPAHQGFYYSGLLASTTASIRYASNTLPLPRGVVCGLKHSINSPSARCMGYDAANYCPPGWVQRSAVDRNPSWPYDVIGARWSWCEYQDQTGVCPPGKCLGNVPQGTVCGLGYTGSTIGVCEGQQTGKYWASCPAGWTAIGPGRDQGASADQGLTWCERNAVALKWPL